MWALHALSYLNTCHTCKHLGAKALIYTDQRSKDDLEQSNGGAIWGNSYSCLQVLFKGEIGSLARPISSNEVCICVLSSILFLVLS